MSTSHGLPHDVPYGGSLWLTNRNQNGAGENSVSVPPQVRTLNATIALVQETRHYGLFNYFLSAKADHWKSAKQGLNELGAHQSAEIFGSAIEVFGNAGPAPTLDDRGLQIEKFTETQRARMTKLSDTWALGIDRLDVKLPLHVLKHKEVFQTFERLLRSRR